MDKFIQTDVTKRILLVYKYLKRKGFIKDGMEFCRRIKYSRKSWYAVTVGNRDFPEANIQEIIKAFHVSMDYLMHGRGQMFQARTIFQQFEVKELQILPVKNKIVLKYTTQEGELMIMEFSIS